MKYAIEFDIPDNETTRKSIKTDRVQWRFLGYGGYCMAQPVIHAHWISLKDDSGYYRHCVCSNCAEDFNNDVSWLSIEMELPLYCPKCGAKMDEVVG